MTPKPKNSTHEPAPACPCCGIPTALHTLAPPDSQSHDPEAPPCRFCRERMQEGILLIEVEDWGGGPPGEPRRTGRAACVAEAGIRRCVRSLELVEHTLRKRYAFVSQAAWTSFGLAKAGEGEVN